MSSKQYLKLNAEQSDMTARNTEFDTAEEKKFLNGLGTHAPDNVTSPGRKVLLWNYIASSGKRYDWGAIDKKIAVEHANNLYSNLN
jgi:hypothetical protein